jgi:ribonucleoside-diphosphate reductase beta chain
MGLLDYRLEYKTKDAQFEYPEAYDFFELQNQVHWLWSEVPMGPDQQDWNLNLTAAEKNVVGNILKSFAQTEVLVNDYWRAKVAKWFPKPEIAMMCAAFSNMEAIHTKAYAYLNETLELEDYVGFLEDKASKDKIDLLTSSYVRGVNKKSIQHKKQIARSLAIFSAFTEGVNLFSSFAILLSFKMRGKLKKLGNIVEWSVRDESMHSKAGCWLFREFCKEYPEVVDDELKKSIYEAARVAVELESKFIDKVFEQGAIESINPDDLKNFIKNRANVKLGDLGYKQNWKNIDKDGLQRMAWFDNATGGAQSTDFFDSRVTQYSRGNIDWNKAYNFDMDKFVKTFQEQ